MTILCYPVLLLVFFFTPSGLGVNHRKRRQMMMGNVRNQVKMGVKRLDCDDGETALDIDWNGSPVNYTCYHPTTPLMSNSGLEPVLECEDLPKDYFPRHFCMNTPIAYSHPIPTHGDHRPIWPKFGEYQFVPAQRWLHNIEHGAVVMLYHPCAHSSLVEEVRSLVTSCIRKHIISPSTLVPESHPIALVSWGCRLLLPYVDQEKIVKFIRDRALHGPEGTMVKEGQYTGGLIKLAEAPDGSSIDDSVLCPNYL